MTRRTHPGRSGLPLFFVLAFALPWLIWGTAIAEQHGLIDWHVPGALAFWIGLPVATLVAATVSGGWPAVKDLLARMLRGRVGVRWYAAALLLLPAMALASAVIGAVIRHPVGVGELVPLAAVPGLLLIEVWMFLLTEETAWRGFALPRLQRRLSPVTAAVVLGVVWSLWHLPLFLTDGSFQHGIPFAGFVLSTVAMSITTSWLFNATRGSVLLAAILHGVADVTIAYSGVMSSGPTLFWVFVAVQCLVAVALIPTLGRIPASVVPDTATDVRNAV